MRHARGEDRSDVRDRPMGRRAAFHTLEVGRIETVRNDHESLRGQLGRALAEFVPDLLVHDDDTRRLQQTAPFQTLIDPPRPGGTLRIKVRARPGVAEIEHQRKLQLARKPRSQPVSGERGTGRENRAGMFAFSDATSHLHPARHPTDSPVRDEERGAYRADQLLAPRLRFSLHRLDVDRTARGPSGDAPIDRVELADRAPVDDRLWWDLVEKTL